MRKAALPWPWQNWETREPRVVKTSLELVCCHPGVDGCGLDSVVAVVEVERHEQKHNVIVRTDRP